MSRIEEIRERLGGIGDRAWSLDDNTILDSCGDIVCTSMFKVDGVFIANAPTDIRYLLDLVDTMGDLDTEEIALLLEDSKAIIADNARLRGELEKDQAEIARLQTENEWLKSKLPF